MKFVVKKEGYYCINLEIEIDAATTALEAGLPLFFVSHVQLTAFGWHFFAEYKREMAFSFGIDLTTNHSLLLSVLTYN